MLAKKYRLTKKSEFDLLKKEGKAVSFPYFTLSYLKREDKDDPRFGFIITTQISKNASLRNRAKRSLSEGVRQSLYAMKKGYDVVFIAKPKIVKVYTSDLMREVNDSLRKAKLLT